MVTRANATTFQAALTIALLGVAPMPGLAQGSVTVVSLPHGRGTGEVGVSRGDFRAYDVLPTFHVDAAGNILLGDFLNGRIQLISPTGGVTNVIQPTDPAERPLFPAQLLPLSGNRLVAHSANRLSVYDYNGVRLAVRDQIDGVLVESIADGRFLLERPGRQGYTIFDSNLNVVGMSGGVPLDVGLERSTRLPDGRDLWTILYGDGCVAFYTSGQSITRASRVGNRISVVADDRFWTLELNAGLLASGVLPPPTFAAPTDAPPPIGFDIEPALIVQYETPIVGRDGELYSIARRSNVLEIVKWNAAALPPADGLAVRPNRPPVLESIGPRSVNTTGRLTFRLRATDPDGDPLSYSAVSLPAGSSVNAISGFFDWRPTEDQAGTVPIRFEVSDSNCGLASETVTITVNR